MRIRTIVSLVALPLGVVACSAASSPPPDEVPLARESRLPLARGILLPTGARITPTAAPGASLVALDPGLSTRPDYRADHPASLVLSPDGATLALVTSGYNRNNDANGNTAPAESQEYGFLYDAATDPPTKRQVLKIPNTFYGLAFAPNGNALYVPGGVDDNIHVYTRTGATWTEALPPMALGHAAGLGLEVKPMAAGLAVTADGTRAVVANYENDSVSILDLAARKVLAEVALRPGNGVAGGEYPFWVAIRGNDKAYVSSQRDNEVLAVRLDGERPAVVARIPVGTQPSKMILDREGKRLFVANASSDTVSVIDTEEDEVEAIIPVTAPRALLPNPRAFKGSNPNALALSPDERTLYVTDGGTNAVAVVRLERERGQVVGLVPTGWYPDAIAARGGRLFIANAKGVAGPNPRACRDNLGTGPGDDDACRAANQYIWQLEKGSLLTLPAPNDVSLFGLSLQTAKNNHFPIFEDRVEDARMMAFLRRKIRHVIYIIKENRTYDQVLGDLEVGNGDPALAIFPERTAPNHHALARTFVTFDSFLDSGETSGVGWNWSTAGRTTDAIEKTQPVNYAGRGLSYDWEGTNRNINVGLATVAERRAANPATPADPDLLPGTADVSAPTASGGEIGAGYLWDAALREGKTVRNYGVFGDGARYSLPSSDPAHIPLDRDPRVRGKPVFFPANRALAAVSDPFFRGYDMKYPDLYRFEEWEREFDAYAAEGNLPNLELVRLPHDHFGNFGTAIEGVNTPERQMADNDYAIGRLVEKVSKSRFARDTLIFIVEDDAQDGPDHVDAHRSLAYIVGPYVKQGAVIATAYTTVSMVRTIGDVLGLPPLGLNAALSAPMSDAFEQRPSPLPWDYDARVPEPLRATTLPLPPLPPSSGAARAMPLATPHATQPEAGHDATWWDRAAEGQTFDVEDALDEERFNRMLWFGLIANAPYPEVRHGRDLSEGRAERLSGRRPPPSP
ncbi:bifunctional YncE family protein/alkaline phosphatase family protein [Pendulispora albinea]|uniref:Beta-propeller fold lactonase family protein n=1 Tax=Pendulispora albinea TaxID=2741071 RepID=A0ABZ2LW96_9BACT